MRWRDACAAAAFAALPRHATRPGVRLSLGLAASVALHAALVFGFHPAGAVYGDRGGFGSVLTARLSPPTPRAEPISAFTADQDAPAAAQESPSKTAEAAPVALPEAPPPAARPGWLDLPLPGPRYYEPSELDRRPAPLHAIEPESPAEAGAREGTVVLRILVNEEGGVDDVAAVEAQPPDLFEKAAIAAFRAARFSPGMLYDAPVKTQMLVEVEFRNPGRVASGRGY